MNSNYVEKFTDYLQNIPAHKISKTVVDQTATSSSVVTKQPQSKASMNKPSNKKSSGKSGQSGPAVVGGVGIRRPVWIVPSAASSQLSHQPADERKFVRTCCPSRHLESGRPLKRVDCRWEEGGKPQTPLTASVPSGDVIPVEKCPDTPEPKELSLGHGDGLGDNVNHQHYPALASEDLTAGDGHDKRGQKRTPKEFRDRQPSSWAGMLSKAHPRTKPAGNRKVHLSSSYLPCSRMALIRYRRPKLCPKMSSRFCNEITMISLTVI
ncbi:ptzE [Anopheles sinensis]|uniref:PtzE n=1 Tax=Anopheles sinensis TaxID=74873 RepID=A0A084WMC1_ANOSI|nr:ptzE [Anopheles sinensis]